MTITRATVVVLVLACTLYADLVVYEGEVFPEELEWERVGTFDADRALVDGWLVIDVDLGVWAPPPGGEQDLYKRDIPEFAAQSFFVEWRVKTDAPREEISGVGGSSLVIAGGVATNYHTTIASDQARFIVDGEVWWVDIEPHVPHVFRVEFLGDEWFSWSIDGVELVAGDPEADIFSGAPLIQWGSKMWNTPSINEWDYVRYGTIPEPGSGDFDADGDVDLDDFHFFQDCVAPLDDEGGPGCVSLEVGDFDKDGDIDFHDFGALQVAFTGPSE